MPITPNSNSEQKDFYIPNCWSTPVKIEGNVINQILVEATKVRIEEKGGKFEIVASDRKWKLLNPEQEYTNPTLALRLGIAARSIEEVDLNGSRWVGTFRANSPKTVLDSLEGKFRYIEENGERQLKGLRAPQIGAVHAVMGYWTLRNTLPATVVMPTGTGKTDTMLSLFAASQPELLLVLVPSDALREQLSRKFETYGVLQEFGVLEATALKPAVGRLSHGFKSVEAAQHFAQNCNVIVTTPNALNQSSSESKTAVNTGVIIGHVTGAKVGHWLCS